MKLKNNTPKKQVLKNGYLMIFWSLILVIAMVPIMVRTLENSIYVRSEIRAWDTWEDSMGVLANWNYLTMKQEAKNGMGWFRHGVEKNLATELDASLPEGNEYIYTYDYSSASTVPVPTLYGVADSDEDTTTINDNSWNDYVQQVSDPVICNDAMTKLFPLISYWKDCDAYVIKENGIRFIAKSSYSGTNAGAPNYLYTVPMSGTGDAGPNAERCSWTLPHGTGNFEKYNSYLLADGTTKYIDLLDDPCNWGKLYPGEVVAIPLFIRDPEDPTKTIVLGKDAVAGSGVDILTGEIGTQAGAKLLSLRLRMPCLENDATLCRDEDRMVIDLIKDEDDRETILLNSDEIVFDNSNKLIDWAIVDYPGLSSDENVNILRPREEAELSDNKLERPLGSPLLGGRFNYEITSQRFMVNTASIDPSGTRGEFFIRYVPSTGITAFNLLTDIYDNSRRTEIGEYIQLRDAAGLARQNGSEILNLNELLKPSSESATTISGEAYRAKYPFLVLKLIDWPEKILSDEKTLEGTTERTRWRIPYIEYQLVSDRPLGNDQLYIQGQIKHPSGKTFMQIKELGMTPSSKYAPTDTGTVFSN